MNKKQVDEKQLLADATSWFEKKYAKTPKECNVKFIKVWHKPTPLRKTIAVVFAPTKEIGKAFIWEQNVLFRTMGNFWLIAVALTVSVFASFYFFLKQDNVGALLIAGIFISLCFCALLFFLYMGKKCKKLEKIHKWNVEIYYP